MRITDLTHHITEAMPVYPGTEPPIIARANTLEKDGFAEAKLTMFSHTGTHIDAPAHMLPGAPTLDELPAEHYVGRAAVLDFSQLGHNGVITLDELKKEEPVISACDFVIFKTGWSAYWGRPEYFGAFPVIHADGAQWLTQFGLKGIGVDAISIDPVDTVDYPVHKILLAKNTISIENLTNLDALVERFFTLSVLPLKMVKADGSPVRAIAIEY
ncbi:MAG: cyclase family protein [Candidatus Sumerlaeales bacterium]|nr:cyclase family protein [Candidatus Sumerlaeales bacterium]